MSMRKKNSKILKGVIILFIAVLLLELALVVWFETNQKDIPESSDVTPTGTQPSINVELTEGTEASENETSPFESTVSNTIPNTIPNTLPASAVEIVECEGGVIQTPYFPLHYPEEMSDLLVVAKTEDDPFTLEFYAMLEDKPEQRIFDIRLSETVEGNMGVVKIEDRSIFLDVTFYKFSPDTRWTQDEIETILAMQEAANEMIGILNRKEEPSSQHNQPAVEETKPESSVINTISINTPYGTLYYPALWKDYLGTEQTENIETGVYSVEFYSKFAETDECLLFTILFGGDEGDQLGAILRDNGEFVAVNVLVADMELDGWSEEEMQIIFAMKDAMNNLIEKLPLV